jgi:outer membrane murein-binding lipoprotein Lpp
MSSAAQRLVEADRTLAELQSMLNQVNGDLIPLRLLCAGANGTEQDRATLKKLRGEHVQLESDVRDLQRLRADLHTAVDRDLQADRKAAQDARNAARARIKKQAAQALAIEQGTLVRAAVRLQVLTAVAAGDDPAKLSPQSLPALIRPHWHCELASAIDEVTGAV